MNTWQIARVDEQGNKTYITGALMHEEALRKVNDLVRAEGSHKNDFSVDIFMPNREVVKDEYPGPDHVCNEYCSDYWPTATDLVTYMKELAQEDLDEGTIPDLDELLDMADGKFPDAPQGVPADRAEEALNEYHSRAVAIMNEAKAEMGKWLEEQTPVPSTYVGSAFFDIEGMEYLVRISTTSENDMQAIQFSAPDGTTLWLHKPEQIK